MGTRNTDCRKFAPNIFNKSKCSHCFRQREDHSAAALECNRASRKVSKCGYLFVAPDWDFSNPLYRTKRWQRRWIVLYDDGQFTYSVDEHPETVPQASIDMTKVLEVSTAEVVTGHANSIAITAPDRKTFVKGTCPEEAKWWHNILSAFPKAKGRHKRNATFPGGQTTILQSTNPPNGRNRHNSYHKDILSSPVSGNGLDVISTNWNSETHTSSMPTAQDENNKNAGNEITNRVYSDQPASSKSPPTRDKIHPEIKAQARIRNRNRNLPSAQDDEDPVPCLRIEDAHREEQFKEIANTITNLSQITSNRWATTSSTSTVLPSAVTNPSLVSNQSHHNMDEEPTRDETDMHRHHQHHHPTHEHNTITPIPREFHKIINLRPKSLPLASSTAPAIVSAIVKKIPPVMKENSLSKSSLIRLQEQNQSQERGDPDGGCNLDDVSVNYLSNNAELRVNMPAEEILNLKKGWLMKQDTRTREWTKHWFSLRGAALFYYRDPVSEERGVLDGVLDVNSLTNVNEVTIGKKYSFQLTTWDNRRIILCSMSVNACSNWIKILRSAAGLPPQPEPKAVDDISSDLIIKDNTSDDLKSEIEKDFIKAQLNQDMIINNLTIHDTVPESTITPVKQLATPIASATPKTAIFSSDEEYRTASEGGRRDSVDWGSPLSPSPPIPISIFRSKERMRSRSSSSSRLHKRSRSSPPSSRRSTVDSVGSDDLPIIHPVQEELNIDKELQIRLGVAEKERDMLRDEATEREGRMTELLTTLERTELELSARIREIEEARDNLSRELTAANDKAETIVQRLTNELDDSQKKVKDLEDRLSRGIEENEALYKKLREVEDGIPSSLSNLNRNKFKRVDSLSDLTNLTEIDPYCLDRDMLADEYNELRSRFEKAVNEIKAMKKELKESQNQYDSLELSYAAMKQDLERKGNEDRSQLQMMAERIQDLTLKYTNAERQVRTLKQKLAKSEKRRSLSLKGKDSVTVSKELEEKVNELEIKIDSIERTSPEKILRSASDEKLLKRTASHIRRRSLESTSTTDPLQFMVRLNVLEKRLENSASPVPKIPEGSAINSYSSPKPSEHVVERLKCLEGVLVASKDRIEQSLQQLQSLRSSRTRRSVSPIADRKDSIRFVERCLSEVVKLMRDSCQTCIVGECPTSAGVLLLPESNPIKLALIQLEAQLRGKLGELLKQRRVLRERNELTPHKDLELLAERIAFESVCFGKLRDSITRAEDPSRFGEKQTKAEVAETSQLMAILKAKLSGKCAFKPSGSVDVLAGVLARRLVLSSCRKGQQQVSELPPINSKTMEELLRQQNEINLIAKRYKNNAMESLACGLAAETLSYISSNDAVQGAVQEAWRQAQEAVNAELVQSEIAHIMMRNAERFESSITPSFGYTLTSEERVSFENFSDAVHDALRKEMDNAIEQLTRSYDECLVKMKRGQWRLHLEQERNASEGRQLLSEFADIIAHKALVDARIAVLKGQYISRSTSNSYDTAEFSIATLQKYENLFDELANDLQICNPDDILAEADFNFMYKQFTNQFLMDKSKMAAVSNALLKLEASLNLLYNTIQPMTSLPISGLPIDSLQSICSFCNDLEDHVQDIIPYAQHLRSSCEECEKMQESICSLTAYHEEQLKSMQEMHENDLTVLRKQMDNYISSVKGLENERNNLLEELNHQSHLVEDHERELAAITMKLKCKEEECHREKDENIDLMERLQAHNESYKTLCDEKQILAKKCLRQNEEYAALLQERDFIQTELNKDRDRSRKLERRLEMLELEHSKQLACLKEACKDQIMTHCSDITNLTNDEESFRHRYQAEIEQLRTLCEKGLAAMESSHRRIVSDLEEKHREEIDRLLMEKEQALAEETQATLAALDAMRKAHQSEVQREVARFKQEFLRQFHKGEQSNVPVKEKEEELEELRQEILSFSEKYSIKCVENATLEERLRVANQKLRQFQQMQQLELRNQQFRAHLAAEDPADQNFVQGLSTKEDSPSPDSEHVVDVMRVNSTTTITENPSCVDSSIPAHDLGLMPVNYLYKKLKVYPRTELNQGVKPIDRSPSTSGISSPQKSRFQNNASEIGSSTSTSSSSSSSSSIVWTSETSLCDRKRTDRTRSTTTVSKPVEQPKTYKVLAPKRRFNFQQLLDKNDNSSKTQNIQDLKNLNQIHIDQKQNKQSQQISSDQFESDRIANLMIDRRLAVSLSSLSELLNTNTNSNKNFKQTSISDVINNNNNNRDNKKQSVNESINQNFDGSTSNVRNMVRNYQIQKVNVKNNMNSIIDQPNDDSIDGENKNPLDSDAVARKLSSPSPLGGRDVEQHTTSQMRRFELEI